VDEAASIATQLASAAGVDIIGVAGIVEGDGGEAVRLERAEAWAAPAVRQAATPVLPGTIKVTVTVFIDYEIG
jgi:uncharacterized protein YggE